MTELAKNIPIRGNKMAGRQNILDMPRCRLTKVAAMTLNTGTLLPIVWDTNSGLAGFYDTDGMWSSTTPTQIFARTAGTYAFGAQVYYFPAATVGSYRQLYFQHVQNSRVYGQTVVPPVASAGVVGTTVSARAHISLNAGESVTVNTAHNDATSPISFNVGADNMFVEACLIST